MQFEGFCGPAYSLRNIQYDCQTLKNWYLEPDESQKGKESSVSQMVPRRGLARVLTNMPGVSRGGFVAANNTLYWVFGTNLYSISGSGLSGWSATLITNALASGTAPVQITQNETTLFILSSGSSYYYTFSTGTFGQMSGGAVANASSMTFMDSYVVFSKSSSNQFYWTDLLSTSAPALNFATAEASPDRITALINNNLDLWIFGTKTIELWYNYGQNNVTFQRRPNLLLESGCIAAKSIAKINNTLMWLSGDDRGGAQLMMANGYTPQRISIYPMEQQWQNMSASDLAAASAYTFQDGGHYFYVLNIPNAPETYVYDLTASNQLGKAVWSTWTSSDGAGTLSRHLGQGHAFWNGMHVVGDYQTGNLYVMDENTYTDNNNYIVFERTSPHISQEMKRVFYDRLTIDFLVGNTIDLLQDPQVMMQFSDDGGFTWSDERWESAGKTGQYSLKVEYTRLGSGRSRVFRIRCTDPMYWALSSASLDLRAGAW